MLVPWRTEIDAEMKLLLTEEEWAKVKGRKKKARATRKKRVIKQGVLIDGDDEEAEEQEQQEQQEQQESCEEDEGSNVEPHPSHHGTVKMTIMNGILMKADDPIEVDPQPKTAGTSSPTRSGRGARATRGGRARAAPATRGARGSTRGARASTRGGRGSTRGALASRAKGKDKAGEDEAVDDDETEVETDTDTEQQAVQIEPRLRPQPRRSAKLMASIEEGVIETEGQRGGQAENEAPVTANPRRKSKDIALPEADFDSDSDYQG